MNKFLKLFLKFIIKDYLAIIKKKILVYYIKLL